MDYTELNLEKIENGAYGSIYFVSKNPTNIKLPIDKSIIKNIDVNKLCLKLNKVGDKGSLEDYLLKQLQDSQHIIKRYFTFIDDKSHESILGLERLSCNLRVFKEKQQDKFIKGEYLSILINNMINALEYIHSNGFCHRDIKPENILFNSEKKIFVLCDFNNASIYKYKPDNNILYMKFNKYKLDSIIGTLPFVSLFVLLRCLPFPRDDIESLFLTLLFVYTNDYNDIFSDKKESNHRKFRFGLNFESLNFIRNHAFCDDINYKQIKDLIMLDLYV